jgi:hypothetical protein
MFKDKIDNSSSPFEPRIKEKPNSLKPLAITLQLTEDDEERYYIFVMLAPYVVVEHISIKWTINWRNK